MTDDWTPDNLPIMLMNRSLLTATRDRPIRIGKARVTDSDQDAILAMDSVFDDRVAEEESQDGGFRIPSRYEASADWITELTDLPYQVSYYFPSKLRPNRVGTKTYGSGKMTFRVLYEALCEGWNAGRPFIEDYFLSVFESHMKHQYEDAVRMLKQQIADEAQRRRKAHKRYLSNYETWSSPLVKQVFSDLAIETKKDIVASLASGRIPLAKHGLSPRTLEARRRAGIGSDQVFYATGRLIESIVVSVILLDNSTAEKEGIT